MPKIRLIELFLAEAILFLLLWLWNGHVATILSLSLVAIAFSVLAISLIAELLERSKVPKTYYYWMLVIGITPIIVGVFYTVFLGKGLEWLL